MSLDGGFPVQAAARIANASIHRYDNPTKGPAGEALSCDVARVGPEDAQKIVVAISGTHGAEGFCGSGAQVAMLDDTALHADCRRAGVALMENDIAERRPGYAAYKREVSAFVPWFRKREQPLR